MLRRSSLLGSALVCVGLASLWPQEAGAFCRTRTDTRAARLENPDGADEDGCFGEGPEVFWRSRCVSYQIYSAPRNVASDVVQKIVAEAFAKWTQTSCALGADARGDARISIDVRDLGETQCAIAGRGGRLNDEDNAAASDEAADAGDSENRVPSYNREGPNQNAIAFRNDSWPYSIAGDPSSTLGLTTLTHKTNGEILDGDIEINSFDTKVKVENIGGDDYDLAGIITHEVGHFLGIAHTNDATATMFRDAQPGETHKQFLKLDDIKAICAAYPPSGVRISNGEEYRATECSPIPHGGTQRECDQTEGSCKAAPTAPGELGKLGAWLGLTLVALTTLRRRSRTR